LRAKKILGVAFWLSAAAAVFALAAVLTPAPSNPLLRTALAILAAASALAVALAILRARTRGPGLAALAVLVEAADGPRLVTDRAGKVIELNRPARDWLGHESPLAFLEAHIDSDTEGEALVRLRQAADTGLAAAAEVPLAGPGGDVEWFEVSVRPLPAVEDASAGLLLWSATDITARRTISDVLSHERQELADFLYFLPTGVYSADVDGMIRFANQRFAGWLGYDAEDLVGMELAEVIAGSARPHADGEWQGEVQFRARNGDVIPALVLQSTYDDAGVTRTRTLVVRDGVRRDAGAAPGRIAYERFRALFDAAPVAIAIADPDGVLVDCNRAFERLIGQTRPALTGAPLIDRMADDDRRVFGAELGKVLAGESDGAHLDARLAGATVAQTSVFIGPLSAPGTSAPGLSAEGGEIEGAVAHFIDVTEQKNLEVQFAQAQKMQAMGQLAGGVAHDFNNLLTAMIGFCDLLLQRHGAGDPSFADIMQIKQNANRAANLVRQLLAFSRKQPLQPRELNVTDTLTELSHLLTRLIGESIEFKLVHGRDLGLVRVDPGQFDQMIINLAVNARDAMPGGGTLTITTGTETFATPTQLGAEQVPAGRYVRISVADTGKGIPPENLGRIFEPFFSTKKEIPGAGTGLGLATVYGVVRQTGGFILVDSAPGKGANFTIYLPRVSPEAEDGDGAREARATVAAKGVAHGEDSAVASDLGGQGTVLLVEDEDAVRVFASRALKNKGYKVLEARTGEQALDILRDTPVVNLMITDMMMPGMDGGTLARLIRVERPEIRIIVISGYSEEVARGDIVDTADFHFLPKPFSLSQLATKVKEVLAE
jgi:two-component system cell cycle sensor histidine kinase/response regulator CckA